MVAFADGSPTATTAGAATAATAATAAPAASPATTTVVATAPTKTYRTKYSKMTDILQGNYTTLYDRWSMTSSSTNDELRDHVVNTRNVIPKVYVCLLEGKEKEPLMTIIHRPFKYIMHPTKTSEWDGNVFCFIGDLMRGDNIIARQLPPEAFEATGTHKVPKLAGFDALLASLPATKHHLPLPARTAATDELQTRYLVPIPHKYVPLAMSLHARKATPKAWWTELGSAILTDRKEQETKILFDFLRLSCVHQSNDPEPVSGCHVRDEVSHIAKTFTKLGYPDPRLTVHGDIDPRLSTMYRSFCNEDPAPKRVKPMPISVLFRAQQVTTDDPFAQATVDMAWIGFYFLLRPGEYCKSKDNTPIRLQDVTLLIGQQHLDPFTDVHHFDCATHSTITFDQQKNRECGEVIGHGTSGHHIACPTKAIARRVQYLRRHGAEPSTYLCAVRRDSYWTHVTSALVTATLRAAAAALPHLKYSPTEVSSRSLRAGGAMALLCGNIDSDVIRLVGRWKSDAMFRYLHAQALPLVSNLASTMMQHGSFTLLPDAETPPAIIDLINT